MPLKLGSKLPSGHDEARIEIVPLIDIMFFLLAAFMLVSLSQIHSGNIAIQLPTSSSATASPEEPSLHLFLDASGNFFIDSKPVSAAELSEALATASKSQKSPRVVVGADRNTRHGDVTRALDLIRASGIQRIAFQTRRTEAVQP